MADVTTELEKLRSAKYGEEVRGAIISSIEKMNEAAEAAEAWATGESGGTASATNNAKYWAEAAAESAATLEVDDTLTSATQAAQSKAVGETVFGFAGMASEVEVAFENGGYSTKTGAKTSSITRIRTIPIRIKFGYYILCDSEYKINACIYSSANPYTTSYVDKLSDAAVSGVLHIPQKYASKYIGLIIMKTGHEDDDISYDLETIADHVKVYYWREAEDTIPTLESNVYENTTQKMLSAYTWRRVAYNSVTGEESSSTTRISTTLFEFDNPFGITVSLPEGMKGYIFSYDKKENDRFVDAEGWFTGTKSIHSVGMKYNVTIAYENDATVTASDGASVEIYTIRYTDDTLTESGKAADAFAVGEMFQSADFKNLTYRASLSSSDDLNTIFASGVYVRLRMSDKPANSPTAYQFALLIFGSPENTQSSYALRRALLIDAEGQIWLRVTTGVDSWGEWKKIIIADDIKSINDDVLYLKDRAMYANTNRLLLYNNLAKGIRDVNTGAFISSVGISNANLYYLPIGTIVNVNIKDDSWVYSVYEGTTPTKFTRTHRLVSDNVFTVTKPYISFSLYRTEEGETIDAQVSDYDGQIELTYEYKQDEDAITPSEYIYDIPENVGTRNLIKRAYQMILIQYTALAQILLFGSKKINAGDNYVGIPYSSVRPEALYVPQCVSFDSFMTALLNPNSYLYTKKLAIPTYDGNTYYGSVCSAFVAWCYGIDDVVPTTISFDTYPGFTKLPTAQQDVQYLKLGDMMNRSGSHIVIVTGIVRDRFSNIIRVEVSEETSASKAIARSRRLTPEQIRSSYLANRYKIYRYDNIADIPYTPTPWVHVDSLENDIPSYNTAIMPRRGDNANWPKGSNIEIDILDTESFTEYTYENLDTGVTVTGSITGDLITLTDVDAGKYMLRLKDGAIYGDPVYFTVIETAGTTFEVQSGRKVKITPRTSLGTPSSVCFCASVNGQSDYLAVRAFHVLTEEEIAAGYVILDAPAEDSTRAKYDIWLMKVMYKTPFGLYSGQLTSVQVTQTGTVYTETAYEESDCIVPVG